MLLSPRLSRSSAGGDLLSLSLPLSLSHLLLLFFILVSGPDRWGVRAQTQSVDFSVPAGWRKPTSDTPRTERMAQAGAAIDVLTPLFNESSGSIDLLNFPQSANLICVLALHDFLAGNATYETVATNNLLLFQRVNPGFYDAATDNVEWGLAAYYAYRAYNQTYLLNIAKSVWDDSSKAMVTVAGAANGSHPSRTVAFEPECDGTTTAGGVFWLVDSPTNTLVNGESIGPFMALSAYLYEATQDQQYAATAELTAAFIRNHMYNGTIVLDTFDLTVCAITTGDQSITYNSAFWIEGLAVWAAVGNATWWDLLEGLAASTIKFPGWTRSDGINSEDAGTPQDPSVDSFGSGWKAIFVRSLHEVHRRLGSSNADLSSLIESYITVQYNALLDLAAAPGSTNYSSSWIGPPATQLLAWGQVAALDVLNAAFALAPVDAATNSTSGPSSGNGTNSGNSSPSSSSSSSNTGAIAGGVAGGVVGLALLGLSAFFFIRRRRRQRNAGPVYEHEYEYRQARTGSISMGVGRVEPFLLSQSELTRDGGTGGESSGMGGGYGVGNGVGNGYAGVGAGTSKAQRAGLITVNDAPSSSRLSLGDQSRGGWVAASGTGTATVSGSGRDGGEGEDEDEEIDVAAIPGLVRRLNGMLTRLQGHEEAPPRYEA